MPTWPTRPPALAVVLVLGLVGALLSAPPAWADAHNTRSLNTAYDEPVATHDTAHFRVHYTTSGEHATDAGYAETVGDVFEAAWAEEVDALGWPAPTDDGGLGGDGRTDIYLRRLDTLPSLAHALADRFPDGAGGYELDCDPDRCADVSGYIRMAIDLPVDTVVGAAVHEFHHLSQFATAYHVERWMGEGTALWMEGETLPEQLPRYRPVGVFAEHPEVPLAQNDPERRQRDYDLLYAAWLWPRWVADRHGTDVVRDSWTEALDADQEGLGGYDAALAQHGTSFPDEFLEFAAATAAWRHDFPWYGFSDSFLQNQWPDAWDVRREDGVLGPGEDTTATLDHTAYALYELSDLAEVEVRATAPEDVAGGVAIVADRGLGDVTRVTARFEDGAAAVTLAEGTEDATLTAALVNADPTVARPFDPEDPGPVEYAADGVTFTLEVDGAVSTDEPADDEDAGGADGTDDTGGTDGDGDTDAPSGEEPHEACPPDVPSAAFDDVDAASVHADAIDCLVWYELARGTGPATYSPGLAVNRAQMASFLARVVEESEASLPPGRNRFADVGRSVHTDNIERLAAAGIVNGTGDTTYSPGAQVRRDQMASFLIRAFEFVVDREVPAGDRAFTDTAGNVHRANINKAAALGFTSGTTATTYSPARDVRRDQMASFLTRVIDRLLAEGLVSTPTPRS